MGRISRLGWVVGITLLAVTEAVGEPPRISDIQPAGVCRGVASEVTFSGSNLGPNPRLIAPFALELQPGASASGGDASWVVRLTVAPETAVGDYPIRVQTDDGLSNALLFSVGQLPQVVEQEPNDTFETAQVLETLPIVVEGRAAANDVDHFRFAGKRGERLVIDAQCGRIGSGVDPAIRLTTGAATRRFVAAADDSPGLLTDARLVADLPEDGDYVIEVSDSRYQGGGRPIYRLVIGELPMAEEIYPLGGREGDTVGLELRGGTLQGTEIAAVQLQPLAGTRLHPPRIEVPWNRPPGRTPPVMDVESLPPLAVETLPELREPAHPSAPPLRAAAPVVLNGRIDPPGDEDRFVLAVNPGDRLRIAVQAASLGSALDGVLRVLGAADAEIATADDTKIDIKGQPEGLLSPDPALELTVPAELREVTVALKDLEGRGGTGFAYRIVVTPIGPTFSVALNQPELSIPKGGHAVVGVTVPRKDYPGPITLSLTDPPAGVSFRPARIAAEQTVGALSISAAPDASFSATHLKIVGRAEGTVPIEVAATAEIVFAQLGTVPIRAVAQSGLAVAPALPTPVTFESSPDPIEVAHGFAGSIPLKLTRTEGAEGDLVVAPLPLPPGISVAEATIAGNATDGTLEVKTTLAAALGFTTLAFQAKGNIGGRERLFAVPAVTIQIVRPAELQLASATLELTPGSPAELKGKLLRKGAFREPVTIKLNGLPAGVQAESLTVPPDQSEFALPITVEESAKPAEVTAQAVLEFKVETKDYPSIQVPVAVKVGPAP